MTATLFVEKARYAFPRTSPVVRRLTFATQMPIYVLHRKYFPDSTTVHHVIRSIGASDNHSRYDKYHQRDCHHADCQHHDAWKWSHGEFRADLCKCIECHCQHLDTWQWTHRDFRSRVCQCVLAHRKHPQRIEWRVSWKQHGRRELYDPILDPDNPRLGWRWRNMSNSGTNV